MAKDAFLLGRLEAICERLEGAIPKLESRISNIESQRDKAAGAAKAVMIMGAIVSPIFGAIGAMVIDYYKEHPQVVEQAIMTSDIKPDSRRF